MTSDQLVFDETAFPGSIDEKQSDQLKGNRWPNYGLKASIEMRGGLR